MKIFEQNRFRRPGTSAFDLSHEKKLSCNMGDLVPIYLEEILPGDEFKVKSELMLRLAPMTAPIMHRVNVWTHYFFVPNRIIWPEWEDFITAGRLGTTAPVHPTFTPIAGSTRWGIGSLADYFGLPTFETGDAMTNPFTVSQLPFCAYNKIWYDYYRDPNLVADVPGDYTAQMPATQGANLSLRKRAWEKDYLTSCLATPQRGPEVSLPVEVNYKDTSEAYFGAGAAPVVNGDLGTNAAGDVLDLTTPGAGGVQIQNIEDNAISVSINELRVSSAIQRFLEKMMVGGYRYVEVLKAHFGVRSSDARLQRAEYLGGGRQPVVISEVLNTTGTEEAPQGQMAGHGYSVGQANSFRKRFEEHGYVIGIMSILPRTAYQQGIPRTFSRTDRYDYYWPEFANLGEQEVLVKEAYWAATGANTQNLTFGYQQRYAEYKYGRSTVSGQFRTTLANWHMGRIFASQPSLNASFMQSDPTHRIFAVTDPAEHKIWCQVYNQVHARRPMPYFADPRLS